jgi:hypothetical protein
MEKEEEVHEVELIYKYFFQHILSLKFVPQKFGT